MMGLWSSLLLGSVAIGLFLLILLLSGRKSNPQATYLFSALLAIPIASNFDNWLFASGLWNDFPMAVGFSRESEKIDRPIVLGHWLTGTQLALRLALRYPEKVRGVIIASGSACFEMTDTTKMPTHPPLDKRVAAMDKYVVPKWFQTVTRETWDDNNYLPGDYAVNPIMGLRLWREAAEPLLHVWVRYLCEFESQDITMDLDSLRVPTLLIKPGLEGIYFVPGQNYMEAFCLTGWKIISQTHKMIRSVAIPNSRVCIWVDQPNEFDKAVADFLPTLGVSAKHQGLMGN